MLPEERRATGEIAGVGFARVVADIRETHGAIAGRVFGRLGEAARPVQVAHDAIAETAYGATRLVGRTLLRAAGHGAALAAGPDAEGMDASPVGRLARGALSGVWGDTLEAQGNPLTVSMALRSGGRDLELSAGALRSANPHATPKLAVFLHGLCETDDAWRLRADRSTPYGDRLRGELGITPLYVRYNTGLHISENGRRLATLLDEVVGDWPVEVEEIALIGHSMGGLVARSACHYAGEARFDWVGRVAHVFSLGAPHTGAPLEQGAHALAHALNRLPETRAYGRGLNNRSVGIKDLGRGWLTDECWSGQDPEAWLRHTAREIPFLDTATHYFISASVMTDHDHPVGRHIGDLLVLHDSAWSGRRGERLRFPVDQYRHVGGATHFDLLNHPAVGEQIVRWLSGSPQKRLPAGAVA